MSAITINDIIVHDEPRIQDLKLATALEFAQPANIRKLIRNHTDELRRYGEIFSVAEKFPGQRGPAANQYHLNEPQALLICMKSETEKAADVREQLIKTFMAWRRGQLPPSPAAASPLDWSEEPASTGNLKLALVREARLIHGAAIARKLWAMAGLPLPKPDPRDALASTEDGAMACLTHLLTDAPWAAEGDSTTVLSLIEGTSRGYSGVLPAPLADRLAVYGVRIETRGKLSGILVANYSEDLMQLYEGSDWGARWPTWLKLLPGARAWHATRFGEHTSRCVFIPMRLVLEQALQRAA
jgi:hypothetical protein